MSKIILLRHGQSVWNLENRFTGWTDVSLSDKGRQEARDAGERIRDAGMCPEFYFTSYLKRAIDTLHIAAAAMNREWVPEVKDWHLNERHYGALQGLDKKVTAEKYGEEQVHLWRRSYDVRPPALKPDDPRYPGNDPLYSAFSPDMLPLTESLADTASRVRCVWEERIAPSLILYDTVLVAAHGNSLRALAMIMRRLSPREVLRLEIPTGKPWVFELNDHLRPVKEYYL